MGDDRPDFAENDGALGRAALAGLAGRLARLPASHPSAPGYRPGADTAPRDTSAGQEADSDRAGDGGRRPAEGTGGKQRAAVAGGDAERPGDGQRPGAGQQAGDGQAGGGDRLAEPGPRAGRTWPWRRGGPDEGPRPGSEPRAGGGRPGGGGAGGDRDGWSLPERLPRLGGPAGKQARDAGRQRPAARNPGGLGPRAGGAPYRPWFADGGETPWFAGDEEGRRPAGGG